MKRAIIFFPVLFFISCTTTQTKIPEWVMMPPPNTNDYTYFIATGESGYYNEAETMKLAKKDAVEKVKKIFGVEINEETPPLVKAEFDNIISKIEIFQIDKMSLPTNEIRIAKKYVCHEPFKEKIFLLIEISNSYFEKEIKKIESIIKEQNAYYAEKEGDEFFKSGKIYQSIKSYLQAAFLYAQNTSQASDEKFNKNLNKAIDLIKSLTIKIDTPDYSIYVGENTKEKIIATIRANLKPVADLPIDIIYKNTQNEGKLIVAKITRKTDAKGHLSFSPQVNNETGEKQISFKINLDSEIEKFEQVDEEFNKYLAPLYDAINNVRYDFDFNVLTRAKEIPTGVMIIDLDKTGNLLNRTVTASAIINELKIAGFDVELIPVDYRMITFSDLSMLELIKKQYNNKFERIILGSAKMIDFEEDDNSVSLTVDGEIKVVEIATGEVLFSAKEQKKVNGINNNTIIFAAFKSLGRSFGEKITKYLP